MIVAGDRVRVYATLCGVIAETKGKVIEWEQVDTKKVRLHVKLDNGRTIYAHPKQCRKLKKSQPRRIFIPERYLKFRKVSGVCVSDEPISNVISNEARVGEDVEFVEVRK